ncbi:M23 family metallopeptidase [Allomeiothermus silvanus]|nr:M23 family metallopeptidase [Allomeiothermus silvanus]
MLFKNIELRKLPKWALPAAALIGFLVLMMRTNPKPKGARPSGRYFYPMNPFVLPPTTGWMDTEYHDYGVRDHRGSGYLVRPGYWHPAVDLNNPGGGDSDCGQSVHAITDGVVIVAGWAPVIGERAVIWHEGPGVWSVYWHLRNLEVKPGSVVMAGQKIAEVGRMASGGFCHLHFGVYYAQPPSWDYFPNELNVPKEKSVWLKYSVDPLQFLNKNKAQLPPKWERD